MQLFVGLQKYLTLAHHFAVFLQQAIVLTWVSLGYLQRMPSFVCYMTHLAIQNFWVIALCPTVK